MERGWLRFLSRGGKGEMEGGKQGIVCFFFEMCWTWTATMIPVANGLSAVVPSLSRAEESTCRQKQKK